MAMAFFIFAWFVMLGSCAIYLVRGYGKHGT